MAEQRNGRKGADVVKQRIAIVGLGLIGGSLARRLVNAGCEVIAWNHNDRPYET
ncbi:hypothetical protein GT835_03280, partial [Bifidobacterium pseudocatenulatum]|nr:hypothetical protein [Bifidobacterium pseudocatenulatum]